MVVEVTLAEMPLRRILCGNSSDCRIPGVQPTRWVMREREIGGERHVLHRKILMLIQQADDGLMVYPLRFSARDLREHPLARICVLANLSECWKPDFLLFREHGCWGQPVVERGDFGILQAIFNDLANK